jgi:hypothetical protein
MSKKDGGPAYPVHWALGESVQEGMSLRQYYKAHAPEHEYFFYNRYLDEGMNPLEAIAAWRGASADAMLAEDEEHEGASSGTH